MAAYRTVVVGTDGSSTSFAAVDRAAAVAEDALLRKSAADVGVPLDVARRAGIDVLIVHTT